MKILTVIEFVDHKGGTEHYLNAPCYQLVARNVQIDLLCEHEAEKRKWGGLTTLISFLSRPKEGCFLSPAVIENGRATSQDQAWCDPPPQFTHGKSDPISGARSPQA